MTEAPPGKYAAAEGIYTRVLDRELVLLCSHSGAYFSLDPIGTDIWNALLSAPTVEAAVDSLESRYDVERDRLTEDVVRLAQELTAEGLLRRVAE